MRIVVASTYVPFSDGDDIALVDDLERELTARGFRTDVVKLPFHPDCRKVPEQTLGLRLLDLTESSGDRIDRLITVRTPAYALRHPNKVAWFLHHHPAAYAAEDGPLKGALDDEGRAHRDMVRNSDNIYLHECRKVFAGSRFLADRLKTFNDVDAAGVLFPPLSRDAAFRPGPFGDYLFQPGLIRPSRRQALAIEALKYVRSEVRLVIGGAADAPSFLEALRDQVRQDGLESRVAFTGPLSEEAEVEWMSGCRAVLDLAPFEEAYGRPTLGAFRSGKPVVTLTDGGGPEVVEPGVNGLVAAPVAWDLAQAIDRFWAEPHAARRMGGEARATPARRRIDWDHVVESLVS